MIALLELLAIVTVLGLFLWIMPRRRETDIREALRDADEQLDKIVQEHKRENQE